MSDYQLQTELPIQTRRELAFANESERLKLEINQTKTEFLTRAKTFVGGLGGYVLILGIFKYLFPNSSIVNTFLVIIPVLIVINFIGLVLTWRKQRKALKQWQMLVNSTKSIKG